MRLCISFLMTLLPFLIIGQSSKNLELVSNIPVDETSNDVWGFEHSNGTEYAIMGDQNSTRIFSLADPANPEQVADIQGTNSTWRDIKNFNDVVYVVADSGEDGLLVIDMSMIDADSISHTFLNLEIEIDSVNFGVLTRSHNLYVNEEGFMYLSGSNLGNRGVIILDLNENPLLPKPVGIADLQYAHDVYVRDNLMFSSEIFVGQMAIYDIEDKTNPTLLGTIETPNRFTHNIWSDTENQYAFTTDERSESSVGAYDISDPTDIKFLDKFKTVEGALAIPHNTHFHDNYLFTSWYTEGVVVTDVTRPDNMIEVAHFDTFGGESGGFNGCWGAFPFLPSGLLLASDRQSGLFILRPTLVRAAYLEGVITTVGTGELVNGAIIKINSDDKNDSMSDPTGEFKTGQCTDGTFSVTISHPEYFPVDTTITLIAGEVTELNIQLDKKQLFNFQVNVGVENGEPLANADVFIVNDDQSYSFNTMQDGFASGEIFEGVYRVYAGRWGWKQSDMGMVSVDENKTVSVILEQGYEDDFLFDFGWNVVTDASSGEWVRGLPIGTTFNGKKSNVDIDVIGDIGELCYMTGNAGGQAGTDDVDNGETTLISDWIDLSIFENPFLEYHKWFFNDGGENVDPNDTLKTYIITQTDSILMETTSSIGVSGEWIRTSLEIRDFVEEDSIRVLFSVADDVEQGHVLEAGIDIFRISEGTTISTNDLELVNNFFVYPNPIRDQVTIRSEIYLGQADLRVFDAQGRLVMIDQLRNREKTINVNHLSAGVYFLNVTGQDFKQSIKLIKP